jgi:hypothetical protein
LRFYTEVRLVRLVDQDARDLREYEELASAVECPSPDNVSRTDLQHIGTELGEEIAGEGPPGLDGLDLGVAALVYALAAYGCLPAASCRGHVTEPSQRPWADSPVVYFAADREHADRLVPLVRSSGCGFGFDDERPRLIVVEAPSVVETMELAESILRSTPPGLSQEQRARLSEAKREPPDPNQGALW